MLKTKLKSETTRVEQQAQELRDETQHLREDFKRSYR
jgi:hypothetical protein